MRSRNVSTKRMENCKKTKLELKLLMFLLVYDFTRKKYVKKNKKIDT